MTVDGFMILMNKKLPTETVFTVFLWFCNDQILHLQNIEQFLWICFFFFRFGLDQKPQSTRILKHIIYLFRKYTSTANYRYLAVYTSIYIVAHSLC